MEEGEGGGIQVWVKWYGENNLSQVSSHITSSFGNACVICLSLPPSLSPSPPPSPLSIILSLILSSLSLKIPADKVSLFSNFNQNLKAHSLKGIYKKGVFTALKVTQVYFAYREYTCIHYTKGITCTCAFVHVQVHVCACACATPVGFFFQIEASPEQPAHIITCTDTFPMVMVWRPNFWPVCVYSDCGQ